MAMVHSPHPEDRLLAQRNQHIMANLKQVSFLGKPEGQHGNRLPTVAQRLMVVNETKPHAHTRPGRSGRNHQGCGVVVAARQEFVGFTGFPRG